MELGSDDVLRQQGVKLGAHMIAEHTRKKVSIFTVLWTKLMDRNLAGQPHKDEH